MKTTAEQRADWRNGLTMSFDDAYALLDDFAALERDLAEARALVVYAGDCGGCVGEGETLWYERRNAFLVRTGGQR